MPVDLGDPYEIEGDCPTSTFCLAFNQLTRASATWNGTPMRTSRGKIPVDSDAWVAGDCLSATFCMAKGGQTTAVFTGSRSQRVERDPQQRGRPRLPQHHPLPHRRQRQYPDLGRHEVVRDRAAVQ